MDKAIKFVKDNLLSILISCAVVAFLLNVFFSWSIEIARFIGFLAFVVAFTERRKTWTIKQYQLKAKGLTEEDTANIIFVKKWEETRGKGVWRYCIIDGGIIRGAYLWLAISVLAIATSVVKFKGLVDAPGNMFGFIGYTYIAGAIIGVISHRVLWIYNQRRFLKLTDPLNDKHQQKLFQDQ